MKSTTRFATAVAALAGLLFQATAAATDLAELPLTAHLLAKPNVVFGLDDSGSMDMEVMLYSNDGVLWWNFDGGTGWGIDASHPNPALRTVASPWFNGPGDATATWRLLGYLFPSVAEVGSRQMPDDIYSTFAAMPTSQFAFLRWSGAWRDGSGAYQATAPEAARVPPHNPLYYNPLVTYRPWAPAQGANGPLVPANADPKAALSHPLAGKQTFDLASATGIAPSPGINKVFTALPGMTIPGGGLPAGDVRKMTCDNVNGKCGPWSDVTADEPAPAGAVTRVAMRYHPATYWVKEACTLPATPRVGVDDCATAPDGSRLKRYEIRPGRSFPSGRSYDAELQNFANWFQYYRKRKLMLSAAMGETMKSLGGMRVGVVPYMQRRGDVRMYDADAASDTENRRRVAGLFYEVADGRGTPSRETLLYIGDQYRRADQGADKGGKAGNKDIGPMIEYACQRNNAFILTDGYANASWVTVPPWDAGKSEATWGAGAPYATNHASTLADLALRYYTNNPRPDLGTGAVPLTDTDRNPDLHVNTYGLTLGARGTLYVSEATPLPTDPSAWPNPTANHSPGSIDDLWHATINGRGRMYLATTVDETALRIRAGLDDMRNRAGAQGAVGVSSHNLVSGDRQAYAATYNPSGWTGDVTASAVDSSTGAIDTKPRWSAAKLLDARDWKTRVIVTSDGSARGGMPFTAANIGRQVNPAPGQVTDIGVVDHLRGSRAGEGSTYRQRTSLMGPVINAELAIDGATGVAYVASGEGMLHAFNTSTGAEEWAFVPHAALAGIGQTALRDYSFKTQLDGTPVLGKSNAAGTTLLVAGMGAAGRSYYAIDVTKPKSLTESQVAQRVKWTFPSSAQAQHQANMGYSVGRPLLVKTAAEGQVVLVTSGYDNGQAIGDGRGRLWMLNADTGAVIREFTTVAPGGTGETGLAQITGYREDDGTVRRVYGGDLQGRLWKFDLATGATTLVATLRDAAGNAQPITTRPQLSTLNDAPVIMVGTGRLLDLADFGSSAVQTIWGFTDSGPLPDVRAATTPLTLNGSDVLGSVNWTTSRGWRLDLPAGQVVNVDPKFVLGWLHVNTNTAGGSSCAQSSQNYRISVKAEGNAGPASVIGDSTLLSNSANAMSPVVVQSGDAMFRWSRLNDGSVVNTPVPDATPIAARKNAWRAVLR
jgi:type IV pilus assembly protein PilY1